MAPHLQRERVERASLGIISFGVAVGLVWSIFVFLTGIVASFLGWGVLIAQTLSSLYVGYGPSFIGAISGAVWGFVHGFASGVVLAWLYNRCLKIRR